MACAEIEGARLVATDDAGRLRACAHERHRKAGRTREIAAARDRQDDGRFRYFVEGRRRDDEHRPRASLLVARGRV